MKLCSIFPVKKNQVILNSFHGKKICSDPKIFLEIIANFPNIEIKYYFDIHTGNLTTRLLSFLKNIYNLSTSRLRVSNFEMHNAYQLRRGQLYLQLWHGTPIKKVGTLQANKKDLFGDSQKWTHLMVGSCLEKNLLQKSFELNENLVFINGSLRLQKLISMSNRDARHKIQNILLAPSFDESNSTAFFDEIESRLLALGIRSKRYKIGIRKHINLINSTHIFDKLIDESDTDLFSLINKYDLVITDISSIGIEFGLAGKALLYVRDSGINYFRGINPEMSFIFDAYSSKNWDEAIIDAIYQKARKFSPSHKTLFSDLSLSACENLEIFLNDLFYEI